MRNSIFIPLVSCAVHFWVCLKTCKWRCVSSTHFVGLQCRVVIDLDWRDCQMEWFSTQSELGCEIVTGAQTVTWKWSPESAVGLNGVNTSIFEKMESRRFIHWHQVFNITCLQFFVCIVSIAVHMDRCGYFSSESQVQWFLARPPMGWTEFLMGIWSLSSAYVMYPGKVRDIPGELLCICFQLGWYPTRPAYHHQSQFWCALSSPVDAPIKVAYTATLM